MEWGFAIRWRIRRKAIVPGMHKKVFPKRPDEAVAKFGTGTKLVGAVFDTAVPSVIAQSLFQGHWFPDTSNSS
eukprot:1018158-Amphidinium_carterae.2